MNYFIEVITQNKAKTDIDSIYKQLGYTNLTPIWKTVNPVSRLVVKLMGVIRILTCLHRGDTLHLQYPMKKFYLTACTFAHWKGARVTTIVHDLGAFRRQKLTPEQENRRLSRTDYLIVHNETMKQYVISHGFHGHIENLDIFDYLIDAEPHDYASPHTPYRLVYAGGLHRWRNAFLYALEPHMKQWQLELYGPGYDATGNQNPRIHYHGSLKERALIEDVEADFGLVWDGASLDECDGYWGEYLKINNPHKTSFYLRAGIPVIVWQKAAMRPFILEGGLGIAVGSLRELDDILSSMTPETYSRLRTNAQRFSRLLAEGHFAKRALSLH